MGNKQERAVQTSRIAGAITGLMMVCAFVTLAYAVQTVRPLHQYQFFALLIMALVASRLKVRLPGLNGNMSVNLPFILIAVAQLTLLEALLVGLPSCVAQCFPKGGGKPKLIQVLVNASTMAVAVGLRGLLFQAGFPVMAGVGFFLAQTIPVATIIAVTEGDRIIPTWSSIAHLSFP